MGIEFAENFSINRYSILILDFAENTIPETGCHVPFKIVLVFGKKCINYFQYVYSEQTQFIKNTINCKCAYTSQYFGASH